MTRHPRTVALLGLLVLLASLLPWWRHDVAFSGPGGSGTFVETATAWGASWGWAAAVVCAAVGGVLALLSRARPAAVLSAAGVVLVAGPLLLAVSGTLAGTPEGELTYGVYEDTGETYDDYFTPSDGLGGLYAVQRGQLLLSDEPGYRSAPGVGLCAGAGLLLGQAVVAVRSARSSRAAQNGGGPGRGRV